MDHSIFGFISEALAVIKVSQIEKKLGDAFDEDQEISLKTIKKLFYNKDMDEQGKLLVHFNNVYRSRWQVKKIQLVYKRIIAKEENPNDWTFLILVGKSHKEVISEELTRLFPHQYREVTFNLDNSYSLQELLNALRSQS